MNKFKNKVMLFGIIFLFCLTTIIKTDYNRIEIAIQEESQLKLSDPNMNLLHQYDFEGDIVGQDPTGVTLTVIEPAGSGTANIANLADSQQNHVAVHKDGGDKRVSLRDNLSYYGDSFQSGKFHCKIRHDASLFGILFNDDIGTLFRLDWFSGTIGRWSPYSQYTTYNYTHWYDVVVFFNTSLGWMFEIDGVRFGDGYTYPFEHSGSGGLEWIQWCSAFSGGGNGYFRVDDIAFYHEAESVIQIITPENKTYTESMKGYYPATYGFESDKIGEQAQGWWTENEPGCDSQILDSYDGHNNVYELLDNSGSAKADVITNFENKTYGTIELWFELGTSDYHCGIVLSFREPYGSKISFQITPGSNLLARNGTVLIAMPEFGIIKNNSWYHLRFDFRAEGAPYYMGLSEDSYMVYLNGTKANSELLCNPVEKDKPFNSLQFSTGGGSSPDYLVYFDAIGYSWDPNYNIGDNLYEGLLLSFENNTNLDWIGYSLDNQQNRTILGNTTIPMPEDGIHNIQVFGEILGTTYQSDKRYFTVDFPIDIITPEEKIYNGPMSGYYPATYGFEYVEDGALPTDWTFTWDGTSFIEVDDTKDGHHKVLEVRKIDDGALYSGGTKTFENNATAGTVEFWLYKDTNSATDATKIDVRGDGGDVRIVIENQDLFRGDYGSRVLIASDVFMINKWYHIRIDFNISQGGWQVQLDNTWYGLGYTLPFKNAPTEFSGFGIGSHWSGCNNNYGSWLDA